MGPCDDRRRPGGHRPRAGRARGCGNPRGEVAGRSPPRRHGGVPRPRRPGPDPGGRALAARLTPRAASSVRRGSPCAGYPAFKSPPQVARALKDAGYTSCDTASNHTLDDGAAGIRCTLDATDAVGLAHTGSARDLSAGQGEGRSDIDLVLGTHAHIPQAYEKINDTWTVYGLGDQLAGHMFTYDGAEDPRGNGSSIARFTFAPPGAPGRRWTVAKAEFVPQVTDLGPPYRVLDPREAARSDPGRADCARALAHIRSVVLSRGAASAGLTMAP
ncbi:CapA family protein [Streptomyces sp. BE20]|uniref:CapA family protein n=1 Tax=Streptomyces sp. BE20 TaxID=3002525 RepID=UPI003FA6BFB2